MKIKPIHITMRSHNTEKSYLIILSGISSSCNEYLVSLPFEVSAWYWIKGDQRKSWSWITRPKTPEFENRCWLDFQGYFRHSSNENEMRIWFWIYPSFKRSLRWKKCQIPGGCSEVGSKPINVLLTRKNIRTIKIRLTTSGNDCNLGCFWEKDSINNPILIS